MERERPKEPEKSGELEKPMGHRRQNSRGRLVVSRVSFLQAGHPRSTRSWLTPSLKGARVCPVTATSSSSVIASSLFPHRPAPLSGSSEIGAVRTGAPESPGQPLGQPPSQGPPGRSPIRPPRCGSGPDRLPAYGIPAYDIHQAV